MQVTLKVFRFNPEQDKKPHYEKYKIEADPTDRVLDLLEHVKGYIDGTLSYRRSCAHGVCGSDAMRINGRNRLADGQVTANVYRPSDANADFQVKMTEIVPGVYGGDINFPLKGQWEVTVSLKRGKDVYDFSRRVSVLAE